MNIGDDSCVYIYIFFFYKWVCISIIIGIHSPTPSSTSKLTGRGEKESLIVLCQKSKYFEKEPLPQGFASAVFEEVRDKCSWLASRTPDLFRTWGSRAGGFGVVCIGF